LGTAAWRSGRVDPVTLTVTIHDDRGKVVLDKKALRRSDIFGTERVASCLLDLPLESTPAATCRLRIVATRDRHLVTCDSWSRQRAGLPRD
jgi:hypothetical protein